MLINCEKLFNYFAILADEDRMYDTWGTKVTLEDVKHHIEKNIVESMSYSDCYESKFLDESYNHAARIAYLVLNPDNNPIELDVGIPELNYHSVKIIDGNHRIVAAYIRGDEKIDVEYSGSVTYFEETFC